MDGHLVDGLVRASLEGDVSKLPWEIATLEVSGGPYQDREGFRENWDHFKNHRTCRDMLSEIAGKLRFTNQSKFASLRVWALHVYGRTLEVWSMDATSGSWRFARHARVFVPLGWEDVDFLEDFIKAIWRLKVEFLRHAIFNILTAIYLIR